MYFSRPDHISPVYIHNGHKSLPLLHGDCVGGEEARKDKDRTNTTFRQCQILPKHMLLAKLLNNSFMHIVLTNMMNKTPRTWTWCSYIWNVRLQLNTSKLQIYLDKSDFCADINVSFDLVIIYVRSVIFIIFIFCFFMFLTHFNAFWQPFFSCIYHSLSAVPYDIMIEVSLYSVHFKYLRKNWNTKGQWTVI
jgi:hypothetical protein